MLSRLSRIALLSATVAVCALSQPCLALTPTEEINKWNDLQNRGTHALDCNQYWLAEPLLYEALEQAKKFGDSDLRFAKSLGELGRLYTVRGKFDQAEPYLEEEYAVKVRALGKADGKIIPAMASLIKFYVEYGTLAKANPLSQEMLLYVENKIEQAMNPPEMSLKFKKGQTLEGYAGTADSSLHPTMDWALACDEVANVYREQGQLAMADRLYKAALDVKANIVTKQHLALASSYDCIGAICLKRNDVKEAESYLKDALATTEGMLESNNPQVFARLNLYAKCLIKEGKYAQAEQLYLRAQKFWAADSTHDGERARAALELGSLYCMQKKYGQAAPVLRHALQLAQSYHGPYSANLEPYQQKYNFAMYYLGHRRNQSRWTAKTGTKSGVT